MTRSGQQTADITTIDFFERLRAALNDSADFRRSTEWIDCAVLLRLGDELTVWMKWYRGQIIDLHEGPSPLGFTFALSAPAQTWRKIVDLPEGSRQPWARLFNYGELAVDGDVFAYVRVNEALYLMCAHIRSIATGEELR